MKNIKIMLGALAVALMGFASCDDELAQPPVNLPEGGIGTGAWDNPMTAYQAHLGSVNDEFSACWVKGYIVGCVNTNIGNVLKAETADFTVPAPVQTNILMASDPDERNWENCITVQLPSGPVRNALNLGTNPDNQGKLVTILGTTGNKYCSAYGVKSVSAYKWGDMGDESIDNKKPDTPVVTGQEIYSALAETDTALPDTWTIDNVLLTGSLSYIWSWKEYNGNHYLNASAYAGGTNNESLSYCYSPVISLDGYTAVNVSFDHAAKFQTTIKELCKVVVREEGASTWTEFDIPTWPGTTSWAFVNSGEINISAFDGKKIQVGFKYASSTDGADTWEIKNLTVRGSK